METNKEDYILYTPNEFDHISKKVFEKRNSEGYTPYYFDTNDYSLTELKLTKDFSPLRTIKTESGVKYKNLYGENPYIYIFFLKGDGIENIKKVCENIKGIIEEIDEQKKLYLKYPAAVVKKLSEKD